jgi:hypothetical protein
MIKRSEDLASRNNGCRGSSANAMAIRARRFVYNVDNRDKYSGENENYDRGHRVALPAGGGYEATFDINRR